MVGPMGATVFDDNKETCFGQGVYFGSSTWNNSWTTTDNCSSTIYVNEYPVIKPDHFRGARNPGKPRHIFFHAFEAKPLTNPLYDPPETPRRLQYRRSDPRWGQECWRAKT